MGTQRLPILPSCFLATVFQCLSLFQSNGPCATSLMLCLLFSRVARPPGIGSTQLSLTASLQRLPLSEELHTPAIRMGAGHLRIAGLPATHSLLRSLYRSPHREPMVAHGDRSVCPSSMQALSGRCLSVFRATSCRTAYTVLAVVSFCLQTKMGKSDCSNLPYQRYLYFMLILQRYSLLRPYLENKH